jgi:hypothetical protein
MLIFRESRGLLQFVKLSIQWIYIIINIYFHYVDIYEWIEINSQYHLSFWQGSLCAQFKETLCSQLAFCRELVEVSALIRFGFWSPIYQYFVNVCFTDIVLCIHECDFWTLLGQPSSLIFTGDGSKISAQRVVKRILWKQIGEVN